MKLKIYLFSVVLFIFSALKVSAQEIKPSALKQIQSLLDEKESRTPAQKKMASQLWYAVKMSRGQAITSEVATLQVDVNKDAGGRVPVNIQAQITDALIQAIINAGGEIIFKSATFSRVNALIPLRSLEQIASLQEVKSINPAFPAQHASSSLISDIKNINTGVSKRIVGETPYRRTEIPEIQKFNPGFEQRAERIRQQVKKALAAEGFKPDDLPIGAATSQGDVKHNAALARTTFSVNGTGVKIGVLSDSYNAQGAAAANVTAGDLPGIGNPNGFTTPVTVLSDVTGRPDEGRAMLQIIHDLAPGAQLFFASAFISDASFAQGILDLRAAGCDIICDDVFYLDEPVFQDGFIAQAVNTVTASGALYFSSAGNQGNKNDGTSSVWEGDFVDGGPLALLPGGTLNNFSGGTTNNQITFNGGNNIILFWSDPLAGSTNDYDLFCLNSTLTTVVTSSTTVQSGTQDPLEFINPQASGNRLVVFKKTGAAIRALHLNTIGGGMAFNTQGQTGKHASAAAAFCVAATQASGGGPFTGANVVENFSSDGPRRKFYNPNGTPITPGNFLFGTNGGVLLQKPDVTAADGVSTTLPGASGLNPFFGTSAAAPHAAAIAALLRQRSPLLTPSQMRTALTSTAIDIETPGVDRDAGFGIVMALEALTSVSATPGLQSTGATLVTESCVPGNSVIDPNETVTVSFCVQNIGGANTTNLVGTLLATGGVTSPGAPQNYGVLTFGGAPVCRNFTFSNNGVCGGTITASIQFQDGATNLGTFTFTFQLGVPVTSFTQNFDAVVAPALPAGWTTSFTGAGTAWITQTTNPFSAPNAAFGPEAASTGVTNFISPTIPINTATSRLSFRNLYNLEAGFDGELLEIKIGAGAFQDIITAGGSFVSGGYNGVLDPSTAFPNRNAWTGISGGTPATPAYINSVVNLPAAAAGQNIQLRWVVTSDAFSVATGAPGVRIDNISITDGATCCITAPGPTVTINQAAAQADPTTTSPINFTVVFSEAVTGFATGDVALSGTAGATTGTITGSGTTYNVAVTGMTANGTVIATVPAGVAVNGGSFGNAASTSTDNTVTFNGIPPTVTINQAAAQADPTATSPINFTVVFNEAVSGFTTGDVTLSGTAGATTATVTGSGTTYNVAVSGMTAGGTVIANIGAGVAVNAGGVGNLASTSTDNTVTYLNTPPTVTINQAAAQADPAVSSPINFTVVFNEPVTGFATGDVTLSGTAGATTGTVTGSGTTYNVAVSGMTGAGTVIATIAAGVAIDIDGNGNLASTSTDNTVTFINCVLTCPGNITVNNTPGQCGAIVNFAPTSTAGCGTVTATPASGSFFPKGTTTVTVTTSAGATCTFTVTVNDTQAPVITCPANIVKSTDPNQCGAVVTFPFPTVTDNCPFGTIAPTPFSITQSTSTAITAANSAICGVFPVHNDNSIWRAYDLGPLALPGPFTVNTVTFGIQSADAGGAATSQPVQVRLYTSAGAFPAGARTLVASQTYTIPDQAGTLFTATLTTPPTVPANAILVLELFTPDGTAAGNSFIVGSNTAPQTGPSYISAPACAITTPTDVASIGFPNMHVVLNAAGTVPQTVPGSGIVSVPASGSFFPKGTTTVTSTATDNAGNTAVCTFTVTVNDTQAPAITCPANISTTTAVGSCTATVNYAAVTATDNCPGTTVARTVGLASGSAFPIGVTTVTHVATDAAGNTSTCSFTVTVADAQLPVIGTQPANRTVCAGIVPTFSVVATNATSYQWQIWNGTAWTNITGATSATLTLPAATTAMNDNSYRVIVTGLCSSVTSGFATLFVNPLPTVSLAAAGSPVLLPTQTTGLIATVNPTGGTFAWFKNGAAYTGPTTNLGVGDVGTYRFIYTDLNGCVSTSNDVVVSAQASGNFYITPNPNVGAFSIRFFNSPNESVTVSVYNSVGEKVLSKSVTTTALAYTKIDVDLGSKISGGIYLVEVHGSDGKLRGAKRIIVGHR